MENKIKFTMDDGEVAEMFVIEEAKLNGSSYLLVTESEEDEAVAYVMKQVSKSGDDVSYELVEDDKELNAVAGLFEELLDGEVDLIAEDD